ncbi:MAG: aminodeoxychorismate synthase component I, partial [Bacteroidota bacterium]
WAYSLSQSEYFAQFEHIQHAIRRGDTYQVNFCMRQSAHFEGKAIDLFHQMATHAPYAALIEWEEYAICSASPELFFTKKDSTITARPMKGTIARGRTTAEDAQQVERLKTSAKDRAENVMIVDMIRNDLGRIARAGTVDFPHLYSIEKYPTVWQMTSTITAEVTVGFVPIMKALFPCASITGAPKTSTMQIIHATEQASRHIYTGTIGFIAPDGSMQFNVAIRTALLNKQTKQLEYGMGSGVTVQSDAQKEYEECLLKTQIIQQQRPNFKLLESMRFTPATGIFLLERHLERLRDTAQYFNYNLRESILVDKLEQLSYKTPQKIRLLVADDGSFEIQHSPISIERPTTWRVALADTPVDQTDVFLWHKTTHRPAYKRALAQHKDAQDVILYNRLGELTESCYGNIVIKKDGVCYTPPVSCGLLDGTLRRELVELGWLQEEILYLEDLRDADQVYIINSVRLFVTAQLPHLAFEYKTTENAQQNS